MREQPTHDATELDAKRERAKRDAHRDAHQAIQALQEDGFSVHIIEETPETITILTSDKEGRERRLGFMKHREVGKDITRSVEDPGPMPGEERAGG
jgi:hypothetical protein